MRVRRFFIPPRFADEEQTERARVLHFIICSLLLVVVTQLYVAFFLLPQHWVRYLAIILTFLFTLPPLLFLNHRGHTRLAGVLLMLVLWLLITVLSLTAGGIHDPVIFFYPVNLVIALLLFGGRGGVIVGIIYSLTGLGLVLLEKTGHLPPKEVAFTPVSILANVVLALEFIAIFLFLAHRSVKCALKQAKEAGAALRRSHEELETRVQERTAELREVNAELQKVNTKLQGANRELDAFSYSVSHDLQRPLRAVTGFTEMLMADYVRDLPVDAQKLLTMTRDGAQQMNQLIEALLNLSRIDRQPLVPRPVNLTALVREIIKELRTEQPGREMDIRVAELPECMGDPALLRQVFVNLLSNAMKYTRNRPVAVIEVGLKIEEGKTVYFVRDNGAGFDMRHADKLFGVFQRLHSAEQFTGTGVGLSIVRRIIHRHGGRIWAYAAVDKGATFYFTLPWTGQKTPQA